MNPLPPPEKSKSQKNLHQVVLAGGQTPVSQHHKTEQSRAHQQINEKDITKEHRLSRDLPFFSHLSAYLPTYLPTHPNQSHFPKAALIRPPESHTH